MMQCALCKESGKVMRLSHIIPRSFHKKIKKGGRNVYADTRGNVKENNQTDFAQQDLLCADCEPAIGRYEKSAIEFLNKYVDVKTGVELEVNIDSLLLFVQSVLWRSSVSNVCDVKFDEKFEEELRCAVLNGNPIDFDRISIKIGVAHSPIAKGRDSGIIVLPWRDHFGGHENYNFVCGGVVFSAFIPGLPMALGGRNGYLNKSNSVVEVVMANEFQTEIFVNMLGRIQEVGKKHEKIKNIIKR